VREQSNHHWLAAPRVGYTLTVKDPQNKTFYRLEDTALSEFGAMQGEFPLLEQGAAGWYRFELEREDWLAGQQQSMQWTPMTVLVNDFTPAPFKVTTQLNGEKFWVGDTLGVDTEAVLLSGGPLPENPFYTEEQSQVRARKTPYIRFDFVGNTTLRNGMEAVSGYN